MDVDEVQTGLVQASQEGRNVVPTDGDQIWWAGIGVSVLCQGPGKFVHHRRTSTGFGDDGGRECPVAREFRCQLRHRGVQKAGDGTCQIETPSARRSEAGTRGDNGQPGGGGPERRDGGVWSSSAGPEPTGEQSPV